MICKNTNCLLNDAGRCYYHNTETDSLDFFDAAKCDRRLVEAHAEAAARIVREELEGEGQ